mmetsp:Transcript_124554/g.186061  ORF Transcript_124554/g.186061 Transcript_124554/m.186061 type:complete len:236 (-) Transcript_124554:482-1189(-)
MLWRRVIGLLRCFASSFSLGAAGGGGMSLIAEDLIEVEGEPSFDDFLELFLSLDDLDDFLVFFDFLRLAPSAEVEELDDPDIRAVFSVSVVWPESPSISGTYETGFFGKVSFSVPEENCFLSGSLSCLSNNAGDTVLFGVLEEGEVILLLGSDLCLVIFGEDRVDLRLGLGDSSIAGRDFRGFFKAALENAGGRLNAGLDRNAAAIESRTILAREPAGFGLHSRESSESILLQEE